MSDVQLNINSNIPEQMGAAVNSLKGLKAAYKEAMNGVVAGTEGAAAKAADLKDQLEDLNDATKSLKGSGVEKLNSSMNLLKEGFTNADPGKLGIAMKGLGTAMSAIPIFLIIEGIKYLIDNFEKLRNSGGLLGKVFSAIGVVVDALIQGFKDLTDWLGLTNNAMEDQAAASIAAIKKTGDAQQAGFDHKIALDKASGKSTVETEILKQKAIIKTAELEFEQMKAVAAARGEVTEDDKKRIIELGKIIHDANLAIQVDTLTADTKTKDELDKSNKAYAEKQKADKLKLANELKAIDEKQKADALKSTEQLAAETDKLLAEEEMKKAIAAGTDLELTRDREVEKLKIILASSQKGLADELSFADGKAVIEENYESDKAKRQQAAWDASYGAYTKALEGEAKAQTDANAKTVTANKEKNDQIDKDNKELEKQTIAGINSLASSIQTVLGAVSDYNQAKADEAVRVNEDALNTQLSALEAERDAELNQEGLTSEQKIAIQNRYAQADYQLKLQAYTADTAIKKKAFEQDKKMKIAQAVISTITGAISAVTGMISAIPGPVGIVLGVVAGLAVTAAGVLQVAKIKATQFEAGSPPSPPTLTVPSAGGDSGVGGSAAPATPSFDLFGNASTGGGTANNASGKQAQPPVVKAYVVSQEITDQQTANNYSTSMGAL